MPGAQATLLKNMKRMKTITTTELLTFITLAPSYRAVKKTVPLDLRAYPSYHCGI
jgi:hypothetical protein